MCYAPINNDSITLQITRSSFVNVVDQNDQQCYKLCLLLWQFNGSSTEMETRLTCFIARQIILR